ncbi:unnamed protein product, partial [Brassica oleracea var. botrytis]
NFLFLSKLNRFLFVFSFELFKSSPESNTRFRRRSSDEQHRSCPSSI